MRTLLQVNSVANWGSTGKIAEQIGQVAMRYGWKSYIAYGRMMNQSQNELVKIGNKRDTYGHVLGTMLTDRHGEFSRCATKDFLREVERIKPDIIHLHNIHGYYLNTPLLFDFLAKAEIPVVWTLHDCWAFTGHCAHFISVGCEKWKTQCWNCFKHSSYPSSWVDNSFYNYQLKKFFFNKVKNMTLVPVSDWLSNLVRQSFLGHYDIQRIYNGIDVHAFQLLGELKREKMILMGVASAWSKNKGITDYIELSRQLDPRRYQIRVVGGTRKTKKLFPPEIEVLPRTNSVAELVKLYNEADVVLNLSYAETFGLTTVEGFACGAPGIVYNCTASPELVSLDTGFIVEQGDIDGVIAAIYEIERNGKACYTAACRKRAEECFNKDKQFEKYIDLYNQLLEDK